MHTYRSAVVQIQRIVRGHAGRRKAKQYRDIEDIEWNLSYLGYFALQIQRCYRGHRVRRHELDFYARKRFLEGAATRGEELKKQLENYADHCLEVTICTRCIIFLLS